MKRLFISLAFIFPWSVQADFTKDESLALVKNAQSPSQVLIFKIKQGEIVRTMISPLIRPVFSQWQNEINPAASDNGFTLLNHPLANFYAAYFPKGLTRIEAEDVIAKAYRDKAIEYAYFEPIIEDAGFFEGKRINKNDGVEIPDFEKEQFYLEAAPTGVGAKEAWEQDGGDGKGLRVLDVETGWFTDHLEFFPAFYDNGKNAKKDHGTAVWGMLAAKRDGRGVSGIVPEATVGIAGHGWTPGDWSTYPPTIASVLELAVLQLKRGDVLLIEQQAPAVDDLLSPIEYFPAIFEILKSATRKGIHCIAAAGNGQSNLDDPRYKGAFDLKVRDSGCVIVGAAESPLSKTPRERSDFSNYGSRVDVFGYGRNVVTTGYGDLLNQRSPQLATYTKSFGGTSSASPIVTGAVISALGILKEEGIRPSPRKMREALRKTGTPQQGDTTKSIGQMPEVKQLVEYFLKD